MTGLVLWVCGTILAGSACQNAVAAALSTRGNWNNMRQYLREWLYDGGGRARPCGTELDVSLCFAPLLRWVLSWWRSDRLALAIDPTIRGLPRLCYSGGVAHHAGQQAGCVDGPIVELLKAHVIVRRSPKLWDRAQSLGHDRGAVREVS